MQADWSSFYAAQRRIAERNRQQTMQQTDKELISAWKACIEKAATGGRTPEQVVCPVMDAPSRQVLDALSTPDQRVVYQRNPSIPAYESDWYDRADEPPYSLRFARAGLWGLWDRFTDAL
jgi:hypothetical protein